MLGSHNSLSYNKAKQWYLRPFTFMARCQIVDIYTQLLNYDVQYFDIRVTFDKNKKPTAAHGYIHWDCDVENVLAKLNTKAAEINAPIYVRLILERNKPSKNQQELDELFTAWCLYIQSAYKHLIFVGGRRKYDWKKLVEFNTEEPTLEDKYSSTTNLFGLRRYNFWDKIDDWWPWLYAIIHNKKNYKKGTEKDVLFMDFIHIR